MTPVDLARRFIQAFAAGDLEALSPLLHPACRFEGPLLRTATRDAYLAALRRDPPVATPVRILSLTGDAETAVGMYHLGMRPGLTVAQLFRCNDGLITEMVVVFDPGRMDEGTAEAPPSRGR